MRSADAFTQTYDLPPGAQKTGQSIVVNDQVAIQGKRTGQEATATSVNPQLGPGGPAGPLSIALPTTEAVAWQG